MGFLDSFKGMMQGGASLAEEWNQPSTIEEIDTLFQPDSGTHIIYKHSFTCSICIFAKNRIEPHLKNFINKATPHFIDVKKNRPLSNRVAELSGVRHESPQLLVVHNGEVYWYGSHGDVSADPVVESLVEIG